MNNNFRFGKVTFKIQGVNFVDLINEIKKQNIALKKIERISPTEAIIVCYAKHYNKTLAILKNKCYTITQLKGNKISNLLNNYGKRIGLLIGIAIGVFINIFASFFVWNISLYGEEKYYSQICCALQENGVNSGVLKSQISSNSVEQIIYKNIPEVSLVNVSFRGSCMVINYTIRKTEEDVFNNGENYGS